MRRPHHCERFESRHRYSMLLWTRARSSASHIFIAYCPAYLYWTEKRMPVFVCYGDRWRSPHVINPSPSPIVTDGNLQEIYKETRYQRWQKPTITYQNYIMSPESVSTRCHGLGEFFFLLTHVSWSRVAIFGYNWTIGSILAGYLLVMLSWYLLFYAERRFTVPCVSFD